MKFRFPLYAQIICVFAINLALLIGIRYALLSNQFNMGWDSLLYSPISEKLQGIAFNVFKHCQTRPESEWTDVLNEYGEFYGVKLYLFDAEGKQIAGGKIEIPNIVAEKLKASPFSMRRFGPGHASDGPPRPHGPGEDFGPRHGGPPGSREGFGPRHDGPHGPGEGFGPRHDGPHGPREDFGPRPDGPDGPGEDFGPGHHGPPGGLGLTRVGPDNRVFHIRTFDGPPGPNVESTPPSKGEENSIFSPHFFGPLDNLLGRPHPPPPARLMIHTENPERFWVGAMIPLGFIHQRTTGDVFDGKQFLPGTLVAVTPNIWQTKLISDYGNLFIIVLGIFGLSLALWWPFVFLLTRALGKLTTATEKIAEGNFDSELTINRFDEIGRLALAISTMSKRLKTYVSGQKRFLGDIAHELCSPVARLQVALEILERTSTKEQENCINDIREEVQQMSMLINELLAFSKAGIQGRETELQAVDLNTLIDSAISRAAFDNMVLNVQPGLGCLCDQLLLERALGNILRNAVRYAGDAGPITLSAARSGDEVLITVSDCGPGVPPEAVKLLGEPFYRPEESRNRSFGGTGLGLAIVKSCVEACHGKFSVENIDPHGLKVEMRLKYAEAECQTPLASTAVLSEN